MTDPLDLTTVQEPAELLLEIGRGLRAAHEGDDPAAVYMLLAPLVQSFAGRLREAREQLATEKGRQVIDPLESTPGGRGVPTPLVRSGSALAFRVAHKVVVNGEEVTDEATLDAVIYALGNENQRLHTALATARRDALLQACVDGYGNRFTLDPESVMWSDEPDYAGFCGCGNPEVIDQALLAYLTCINHDSHHWADRPTLEVQYERVGGEVAWYFCAYMTDALGWTEHGTSVFGAWLTDAGRSAFTALSGGGAVSR